MSERAYCRVYYSIKDDPKFDGIRDDDHHLATWLRLLMTADAIWPASPDLPASARKASVKALVVAELVDLLPGGRFRIHGLDAERGSRRDNARAAAAHRPLSERSANAQQTLTSRARSEPSRAETEPSRAEQTAPDSIDAFHRRTGDVPGPKLMSWINELSDRHGEIRVASMISETPLDGMTPPDYLKAVQNRLRLDDIAAARSERVAEERRVAEKRASLRPLPPAADISEDEAKRIAAEYMAEVKR